MVALDHGLRAVAFPAMDVWDLLIPKPELVCHEDNDVAIRVVRSGRNQTMRYLGRTHGISVAWLHEQYQRKAYTLVYEPSHSMAADLFTKSFSNPDAWSAACWQVCICEDSEAADYFARGGIPPLLPQGGHKSGVWHLNMDGSGTWTRSDSNAYRCRTLFKSGPAREEVHERVTVDAKTGEVLDTLQGFQTAKVLDKELPPPVPRAIRTIFHFKATKATVPDSARADTPTEGAKACAATAGLAMQERGKDGSIKPHPLRPIDKTYGSGALGVPKHAGGDVSPAGQAPCYTSPAPNTQEGRSSLWAGGDRRSSLRPRGENPRACVVHHSQSYQSHCASSAYKHTCSAISDSASLQSSLSHSRKQNIPRSSYPMARLSLHSERRWRMDRW